MKIASLMIHFLQCTRNNRMSCNLKTAPFLIGLQMIYRAALVSTELSCECCRVYYKVEHVIISYDQKGP